VTKPQLLIVAGPNGSGKTALTVGGELVKYGIHLPEHYINADDIARRIRQQNPTKTQFDVDIMAQKQARELRRAYQEQGASFAFETVFSHPSSLLDMQKCRAAGYEVVLAYVMTERVEINLARIEGRVLEGGHGVPEEKVRARYERCFHYLPRLVEEASRAIVFHSTAEGQTLPCLQKRRFLTDGELPDFLEVRLGSVLRQRIQQKKDLQIQFSVLTMPDEEAGSYTGPVQTVTSQFAVQEIGAGQFILHDRLLIDTGLQPGQRKNIRYHLGDKHAVTLSDALPEA